MLPLNVEDKGTETDAGLLPSGHADVRLRTGDPQLRRTPHAQARFYVTTVHSSAAKRRLLCGDPRQLESVVRCGVARTRRL